MTKSEKSLSVKFVVVSLIIFKSYVSLKTNLKYLSRRSNMDDST